MIDRGKHNVIGVQIDAVDYEAAVDRIITAAHNGTAMSVSALAVHGVMTGARDRIHRYRLNHLDLVVPDGQPVRWALNLLYHTQLPDRVYGPALTLKVCQRAAQEELPIYLYGSRPAVLDTFAQNLRSRFPGLIIAGAQPSRFKQLSATEQVAVAEEIEKSGAKITFVGLGCPRQEVWVYEYKKLLPMPLIAVGAAFDFYAGSLPQAPASLQKLGLEWVYRLAKEPGRLWKRYVLLNPWYVALFILQASRLKKFNPSDSVRPLQDIRYG